MRLTHPYPDELRERILAVAQDEERRSTLDDYGRLDVAIGQCFADAAAKLLARNAAHAVAGRARSARMDRPCAIVPLASFLSRCRSAIASVIAERTRITTVADFRRADVAAGGQGAPLLPAVHAMLLGRPDAARVVLNLGGIANITVLASGRKGPWFRHRAGQWLDRCLGIFAIAVAPTMRMVPMRHRAA